MNSAAFDRQTTVIPGRAHLFNLTKWRRFMIWFILWTSLGVFHSIRLYMIYCASKTASLPYHEALIWSLAEWYIWGGFSLIIVRLAKIIRLERRRWWWPVSIHIVLSLVFGTVQVLIYIASLFAIYAVFFGERFADPASFYDVYRTTLYPKLFYATLVYFLIAFVSYAFNYYKHFRDQQERAAMIETRLAQAQLAALKMQLHPHFLFNTLNAITALIPDKPEDAEKMITRLSDLLRLTLENENIQKITLREEMAILNRYLEIQRIRFQDRLHISMDISQKTLEALVPTLILQPLAENAIRHGTAQLTESGHIHFQAESTGRRLRLVVSDNGPGIDDSASEGKSPGRGLMNTRERLQQLYHDNHEFVIKNRLKGGVSVTIVIPLETNEEAG
jgi:signal transduction histidine kinase